MQNIWYLQQLQISKLFNIAKYSAKIGGKIQLNISFVPLRMTVFLLMMFVAISSATWRQQLREDNQCEDSSDENQTASDNQNSFKFPSTEKDTSNKTLCRENTASKYIPQIQRKTQLIRTQCFLPYLFFMTVHLSNSAFQVLKIISTSFFKILFTD